MENEMSSIVQVEIQGLNIAFEIASKTAGMAAQAFARLLNGMFWIGKKSVNGVKYIKNKKLANLSGEVKINKLKLREGEHVSLFKLHVDAIDEFKKACEAIKVPFTQLVDFNKSDDFVHIMVGSSSEKNVNYILQEVILDKVNSKRKKDEQLEKVGEKSSVQEYVDANSVNEDGIKDLQNFVDNVSEYEKQNNIPPLPSNDSKVDEKSISQIKNNMEAAENEIKNNKMKEEGIKTSLTSIIDQDEKFLYFQISKDDSIMVEKDDVYIDKEHDVAYIKPSAKDEYITLNNEKITGSDLKNKLNERRVNLTNTKPEQSLNSHMKIDHKVKTNKKDKVIG